MTLRFTLHAVQRMIERGISRDMVERCLDNPDKRIQNEELRAVKKINEKVLVVIYRVEKGDRLVITAFISSKISKYLHN